MDEISPPIVKGYRMGGVLGTGGGGGRFVVPPGVPRSTPKMGGDGAAALPMGFWDLTLAWYVP